MKILFLCILFISQFSFAQKEIYTCTGASGFEIKINNQMATKKNDNFSIPKEEVGWVFYFYPENNKFEFRSLVDVKKNIISEVVHPLAIVENNKDKIVGYSSSADGFWIYTLFPKTKILSVINTNNSEYLNTSNGSLIFSQCK